MLIVLCSIDYEYILKYFCTIQINTSIGCGFVNLYLSFVDHSLTARSKDYYMIVCRLFAFIFIFAAHLRL